MAKINTVPGYETTYNHFYRAYCTTEKDLNVRYEKKIIQLSELDAEVCKPRQIPCECSEIAELERNAKCDLKKWTYLANAKTEYSEKIGSPWANFTLKSTLPKKLKRGMALEEMEKLVPADSPTYIYTLEESFIC
ncbi:uncharacterized protein LOC106663704 isoform X2 [Cimex lectularius]|uniref:Uncharacterized protein n=1 Tax=Cimex lectularius TaxID=79782 RepID=A0A8I6TEK9_CIMLE|nr:uncharacterized protein LOC106663704 isoform X2 [Cimex lectularius]